MQDQFLLYHRHIDLAHFWWERLLQKGDVVVDATCGNGHDTLFLAEKVLNDGKGEAWGFDIQQEALTNTQKKLEGELAPQDLENVHLILGSHDELPPLLLGKKVKLAVYNLGYLPGSDKEAITKAETTIRSLQVISEIIIAGGAISITCYTGHPGGMEEQNAVIEWASSLPKSHWNVCFHQWINMKTAPTLLLIQRSLKVDV